MENIRYGRLEATDEEVMRAAQLANAHEFIMALPRGYDTVVGERGARLSGGQRQRIAIARALIVNPKVVVLDEPTSALDVTIQKQVLELLTELQKKYGLSYILVTHDIEVVRAMAHRVMVMKDSRIVESGTLEDVIDHAQSDYTRKLIEAGVA